MKKILSLLFISCLIFIFSFSSYAASFSAYGSVSNSTSYVQTLVGYYMNSDEYKFTNDFIVIRTGQYQYDLFFGKELSGTVKYYRLSAQTSGYNTEWIFSSGSVSNFSYSLGNYTAVGNVSGSITSSDYRSQRFYLLGEIFLVLIIILIALRLFRFGGHKIELR